MRHLRRHLQRDVPCLVQPSAHLPGLAGAHSLDAVVAARDDPVQHDGVLQHHPVEHVGYGGDRRRVDERLSASAGQASRPH
jgi:hypothetical protein